MVARQDCGEQPPRVDYRLTDRGRGSCRSLCRHENPRGSTGKIRLASRHF
ncbi:hypothetical protein [Neorhizobium sp. T6_25]|nr:hypothetical protein [Neorhizobium sp. T6_25]